MRWNNTAVAIAVIAAVGLAGGSAADEPAPEAAARIVDDAPPDDLVFVFEGDERCEPYTIAEDWATIPLPTTADTLRVARLRVEIAAGACEDRLDEVARAMALGWGGVDGPQALAMLRDPASIEVLVGGELG